MRRRVRFGPGHAGIAAIGPAARRPMRRSGKGEREEALTEMATVSVSRKKGDGIAGSVAVACRSALAALIAAVPVAAVSVVAMIVLAPAAAGEAAVSSAEADPATEAELATARILTMKGDIAYGEYLGAECVTCHRQSDAAGGIPPVGGLPADYTVRSLVEYRSGIRDSNVMRLMTARLTDEDIAALAAYFSTRVRE